MVGAHVKRNDSAARHPVAASDGEDSQPLQWTVEGAADGRLNRVTVLYHDVVAVERKPGSRDNRRAEPDVDKPCRELNLPALTAEVKRLIVAISVRREVGPGRDVVVMAQYARLVESEGGRADGDHGCNDGVPLETRRALLGHKNGDITTHYSAPELQELIEAASGFVTTTSTKLRQ